MKVEISVEPRPEFDEKGEFVRDVSLWEVTDSEREVFGSGSTFLEAMEDFERSLPWNWNV